MAQKLKFDIKGFIQGEMKKLLCKISCSSTRKCIKPGSEPMVLGEMLH